MMGHRGELKDGDEWDALTRARRFYHWRPGELRAIKRRYNKRQRKEARFECRAESARVAIHALSATCSLGSSTVGPNDGG
jgi:hypothetical protein